MQHLSNIPRPTNTVEKLDRRLDVLGSEDFGEKVLADVGRTGKGREGEACTRHLPWLRGWGRAWTATLGTRGVSRDATAGRHGWGGGLRGHGGRIDLSFRQRWGKQWPTICQLEQTQPTYRLDRFQDDDNIPTDCFSATPGCHLPQELGILNHGHHESESLVHGRFLRPELGVSVVWGRFGAGTGGLSDSMAEEGVVIERQKLNAAVDCSIDVSNVSNHVWARAREFPDRDIFHSGGVGKLT